MSADFWAQHTHDGKATRRKRLDAAGRCCGRKAQRYVTKGIIYCHRCHAEFSECGNQQSNSFWRVEGDTAYRREYNEC